MSYLSLYRWSLIPEGKGIEEGCKKSQRTLQDLGDIKLLLSAVSPITLPRQPSSSHKVYLSKCEEKDFERLYFNSCFEHSMPLYPLSTFHPV
jgi:hypothetical protein